MRGGDAVLCQISLTICLSQYLRNSSLQGQFLDCMLQSHRTKQNLHEDSVVRLRHVDRRKVLSTNVTTYLLIVYDSCQHVTKVDVPCRSPDRVCVLNFQRNVLALWRQEFLYNDAQYPYTCRILAGWPLRNPVTAPRSSRRQSKNRPIFFARSRSSLVLKPFTVFAITESLSSIFHLDTTR